MNRHQVEADIYMKPAIKVRPLQNLHPLNFHLYTLRRMNIFDQKMPLEVTF